MTSIKDISFLNKKALIRVDFNVPFDGDTISDNSRILAAIPTINYVLENGGSCIVMSHLGRPKNREKKLSLARIKNNNNLYQLKMILDQYFPKKKEKIYEN